MSGEDLAVTRHIPQDRRSARHSYDEVARSMVNIAESRYQDHDEATAEWLHQWAQVLTDGRIGNGPRAARRDQYLAPTIPDLAVDGLAIEWPISAFTDNSTPDKTRHIDYNSELLASGHSADNGRAGVSEYVTRSEPITTSETSSTHSVSLPALAVNQCEEPPDITGRQVALVSAEMNQGFAGPRSHAVPVALTESPKLLALSCFAAGVVCCFVLHALLLLTPLRLTVRRPEVSPSQTPELAPARAARTHEAIEPARRESSFRQAGPQAREIAPPRDKASSIVEEFYSSNIELFAKFAQSAN